MWGKVLGAMIGGGLGLLIAWSPALAVGLGVVGLVLGHFTVDREAPTPHALRPQSKDELLGIAPPAPSGPPRPSATVEQRKLAELICPIFIEVARCDGPVVQSEVRAIREFFENVLGFGAPAESVRVALKAALTARPQDIEALVKAARVELKPAVRLDIVRALYDMGLADAELTRAESDMLRRVVSHFNLSEEQLQEITRQYFGTGEEHYRALGLSPSASDEEIRAAFRRLAAESHPDRVASQGPEHVEAAAERFRAVKEAYEELRKLRGL